MLDELENQIKQLEENLNYNILKILLKILNHFLAKLII